MKLPDCFKHLIPTTFLEINLKGFTYFWVHYGFHYYINSKTQKEIIIPMNDLKDNYEYRFGNSNLLEESNFKPVDIITLIYKDIKI